MNVYANKYINILKHLCGGEELGAGASARRRRSPGAEIFVTKASRLIGFLCLHNRRRLRAPEVTLEEPTVVEPLRWLRRQIRLQCTEMIAVYI